MTITRHQYPTEDSRLGWAPAHDSRSLNFALEQRTAVEDVPRSWAIPDVTRRLDQYAEGSCVPHGVTGDLMASPRPDPYLTKAQGESLARKGYEWCQDNDEWDGSDYSGTSVNAGMKWARTLGVQEEHRWTFSIEDFRDGVIATGPGVIGIPWYSGMYRTRPSGLIEVTGDLRGGHCIYVPGYHPGMRISGEDWYARYKIFKVVNSWGPEYGVNGVGYLRYEDLRDLLAQWGESSFATGRRTVRLGQFA